MLSQLAKIEKKRLDQLEAIRNNTQSQSTLAFVAYVMLSILYSTIIVNDLAKLVAHMLEKLAEKRKICQIANEVTAKQLKKELGKRNASIERERNELYNNELKVYWRRVHVQLLVACSKKKPKTPDVSHV